MVESTTAGLMCESLINNFFIINSANFGFKSAIAKKSIIWFCPHSFPLVIDKNIFSKFFEFI